MSATQNTKVGRTQPGDVFFVKSGGSINIESGGKITAAGSQGAFIANMSAIASTPTQAEHNAVRTNINSILAMLKNAGIMAAS